MAQSAVLILLGAAPEVDLSSNVIWKLSDFTGQIRFNDVST